MKKYRVFGTVTGSKYLGTYEADSKEKAEEEAWKDSHISICHHCSSEIEDPEITEYNVEEVKEE